MTPPGATAASSAGGLRERGRILLLSCYELGHAPSGLAVPEAFLRRAGFAPEAVDTSVTRLADAAIDRARLALISVPMHTALRLGIRLAERIRARNPGCRIGFFGLYAPLHRGHLRAAGACWVTAGEAEAELVALAEALDRGEPAPEVAPVQLGRLPFPPIDRSHLPLSRYARLDRGDGRPRLAGYTETTRGCLDTCRHCPVPAIYGGRFFVVPRDRVIADIAAQVEAGVEHITFGDPDFLNGPGHSLAVVREMNERWPQLTFDITAQISHLLRRREHLSELADRGCAFVVSAVESLSDRVLDRLRKRHRRADVELALSLCADAGLVLRPTFVTFTPWTTLADLRELVDVLVERDLVDHVDPVQLSIRLLVPPGSLLLEAGDTRGAFGELDAAALTHRWRHPDPGVDELQRHIAARVAAAADGDEDADDTFEAVRALIYAACGLEAPPPRPPRSRRRVPRLTEPWFC